MSLLRTTVSSLSSLTRVNNAAVVRTAPILLYYSSRRSFSNSTQSYKKKDLIKSAPGWSPEKATESEADVKADREPITINMKQLQQETVEILLEKEEKEEGGFSSSIHHAAEKLNEKFEKFEDKFNKTIEKKGEKAVEKLAHRAEEAGTTLGTATGTIKGKVDRTKETVVHEVKESLDSVKKTVGLGGGGGRDDHHPAAPPPQPAEKIKEKVKPVDDKVDSNRGV
ncbi:hypothetical protein BGZ65_004304 [Modicella reniformis]|uniref:Uncharacterized protein n=1 Tax=Modicella reniformis TaxID=1440133 RepID=A0A9P6LTV3_9FUNG|nr:hypothetical protein BGZ65_004304 [Modicella reniformis]